MVYRLLKISAPFANAVHSMAQVTMVCKPAFTARTLYSASWLRIDGFLEKRTRLSLNLVENAEDLRQRLNKCVDGAETPDNVVGSDDLSNWLYSATNTSDDISLTIKLLQKYQIQTHPTDSTFQFGPIAMRLMHIFKLDQEALQCFNDPKLKGLFANATYLILLDLLFEAGRYQELIDSFEKMKSHISTQSDARLSHNLVVLAFAAAYKQNTPESLKYSLDLMKELRSTNALNRRSHTFVAALALAQNEPGTACEIVSTVQGQGYVTVRNIKALALIRLKRYEGGLRVLQSVVTRYDSGVPERKQTITKDVIDAIRDELQNPEIDNAIKMNFEKIEKNIVDNGHLEIIETLDSLLCKEIQYHKPAEGRDTTSDGFNRGQSREWTNNYNRTNQQGGSYNKW